MQTRSKKNNTVVSVNPVRNIVTRSQTSGIKPAKNSIRTADLHSSWFVTDNNANPSTEGADLHYYRFKMTIVDDDEFDYLNNKNDEDYDDDAEDCDDDDDDAEEFNNIHKMKTRSKTSGKRQVIIDDDFVYNDDACDADWK
jgi:hypothetical protein